MMAKNRPDDGVFPDWPRFCLDKIQAALADTPVVFLSGARQTGKSTLLKSLLRDGQLDRIITFDDLSAIGAAKGDPTGFVAGLQGRVGLDEIQRVPELFLPIKAAVDAGRRPGRFVLTGSAQVLLLPRLADSLAGRMAAITLYPVSRAEVLGVRPGFLERLLSSGPVDWPAPPISREEAIGLAAAGGYPEALRREGDRRAAWFDDYTTTVLYREVRDLAQIDGVQELPRLLRALAARTGNLLNTANLCRDLALPATTLKRYHTLLRALHLVIDLPAWTASRALRLAKAPKVAFVDTGLAAHLLGGVATPEHPQAGALLENLVSVELLRQASWAPRSCQVSHFRSHDGCEVDLVLEAPDGGLSGVEVKLSETIRPGDARGLRKLREVAGSRFRRGVILHPGRTVLPLGGDCDAVPLSALFC